MPAVRRTPVVELIWRVHRVLFRASGGRIGTRLGPCRCCSPRCAAGRGAGEDREPPWWLSLRNAGEGEVMVAGESFRVRAREAEGAERLGLWSEATRRDDAYAEYETRTARRIAVVVLERA